MPSLTPAITQRRFEPMQQYSSNNFVKTKKVCALDILYRHQGQYSNKKNTLASQLECTESTIQSLGGCFSMGSFACATACFHRGFHRINIIEETLAYQMDLCEFDHVNTQLFIQTGLSTKSNWRRFQIKLVMNSM